MNGVPIKEVKMAQRVYYLALKFEEKIPAPVVGFAKEVCNRYTKMAKTMNLKLSDEELINSILK